jgi:hypothetical protein
MTGYKLFRKRGDGTYGSLFVNCKKRLVLGVSYPAEVHYPKNLAFRPGWHILAKPIAPHLTKVNRVWCRVEFELKDVIERPESQGGVWYLGSTMTILEEV